MPPLDEGSIMDMPVTSPRASVTEAADDLKARDALLREMPEVEAGRRQGRPRRHAHRSLAAGHGRDHHQPAPARALAQAQAGARGRARRSRQAGAAAEQRRACWAPSRTKSERRAFLDNVASSALVRFDAAMRRLVIGKQMDFEAAECR